MSEPVDRVAFLTARLDEDEAVARAAMRGGPGQWSDGGDYVGDGVRRGSVAGTQESLDGVVCTHIARHDPARVLADVAARRAIVARYDEVAEALVTPTDGEAALTALGAGLVVALMALASVYADHPDFDPSWRL